MTRFDTDNKDFEQKLCDVIQVRLFDVSRSQYSMQSSQSANYWFDRSALNVWSLTFRDVEVEREFRKHFLVGKTRRNEVLGRALHEALLRNITYECRWHGR